VLLGWVRMTRARRGIVWVLFVGIGIVRTDVHRPAAVDAVVVRQLDAEPARIADGGIGIRGGAGDADNALCTVHPFAVGMHVVTDIGSGAVGEGEGEVSVGRGIPRIGNGRWLNHAKIDRGRVHRRRGARRISICSVRVCVTGLSTLTPGIVAGSWISTKRVATCAP